ncbi:unnamed protein product [Eretmochelys imbricata]
MISILRDNNRMCLGEESQGGEFLIEFRTCKLRYLGRKMNCRNLDNEVRSPVDISRF